MWRKLVKYGYLSDKQIAFAKRLIAEAKAPKRAPVTPEVEATEPAPSGRVTVTGTILGFKRQESIYGTVVKMLVRSDTGGWKVWITRPAMLSEAVKGAHVRFAATLTRSDKDQYFAFGSRPAQASILSTPAGA